MSVPAPSLRRMEEDARDLLAFAALTWRHDGSRDTAIREQFGITPTEFYRRLHHLIDRPEAVTADPVLVHRLRRQRELRRPWEFREPVPNV